MPAKKKNAFFFFMAELHRQKRDRGEDVPFAQMQEIASPHWKTMTPEQKFKYQAMAKAERGEVIEAPVPNQSSAAAEQMRDSRMNNQRQLMSDFEANAAAKLQKTRARVDEVKSLRFSWPPGNDLIREDFYFVHAEYFVLTQEGVYFPCEISAVKMSMIDGIVAEYHTFVDPGPPPPGYIGEEKDRSETRHLIPTFERYEHADFDFNPPPPPTKGDAKKGEEEGKDDVNNNNDEEPDVDKLRRDYKNYANLYCRLMEFFDDGRPNRRAFTGSLDVEMVQGCLDWVFEHARGLLGLRANQNDLPKVLPLGNLFQQFYMHSQTDTVNFAPSINSVERQLANEKWNYSSNTRCFFHEQHDVSYCTLGQTKRWCYSIFDAVKCESIYDFELTADHMPPEPTIAFRVVQSTDVVAGRGGPAASSSSTSTVNGGGSGKMCRTDQRPEYRDGRNIIVEKERGGGGVVVVAGSAGTGAAAGGAGTGANEEGKLFAKDRDELDRLSNPQNWPSLSKVASNSSINGASPYFSSSEASLISGSTRAGVSSASTTSGFTASGVSRVSSRPESVVSTGFGRGAPRLPGSASVPVEPVRRPSYGRGRARV